MPFQCMNIPCYLGFHCSLASIHYILSRQILKGQILKGSFAHLSKSIQRSFMLEAPYQQRCNSLLSAKFMIRASVIVTYRRHPNPISQKRGIGRRSVHKEAILRLFGSPNVRMVLIHSAIPGGRWLSSRKLHQIQFVQSLEASLR